MHETAAALAELQRLLDTSHAAAGAHLGSIFTLERRASASEVAQLLRGFCVLALGTVARDGAPLVAPVDGLFFRGRFSFSSSPASVRFRHIQREPRVRANYNRGEDFCVIVHGVAREIDKSEPWSSALRDYNREVYGASWDDWGTWATAPYAVIEPHRMFAALMKREILEA